jgi:high-affinity Fe2+/Pb2+ permease
MTDLQLYSALVGLLLPLLTAIVVQQDWSTALKAIANAALSFVAAVVLTYTQGDLDGDHIRQLFMSFMLVFVPSLATYLGFWKPSAVAPKLNNATNFGSKTP